MKSNIFQTRLKELRDELELSQTDVAEELQIDRSTLAKYENGDREPSLEKLTKIAEFFNVTTDWLLGIGKKYNSDTQDQRISESKNRKKLLNELEREGKQAEKRVTNKF